MKIGLISSGIMGKLMAENLFEAGYDLMVNDLNQASVDEIVAAGARAAANAEIGEACDVVLTMVPDSPQVKTVMLGEGDVVVHIKSGSAFIDMSSTNPVAFRETVTELVKHGIEMLNAFVSGGEPKAIGGTLSFMADGRQEVSDQYKELLGTVGASVVCRSDVGADNTTKLANRIIMAYNIQALSEALTLAKMAGVGPELVFQIIHGGLADSIVMNVKALMIIEGNDKPGFRIDLHVKDLNNALDYAHTVSSPPPMTVAVQKIFQWLYNNNCGQGGHSSIIKYYKKLIGVESL